MNLISDPWLPAQLNSGTARKISFADLADSDLVDINAPRPDFRGGIYQLLIGLLQLSMAPEDEDEWKDLYQDPPSRDDLAKAFSHTRTPSSWRRMALPSCRIFCF